MRGYPDYFGQSTFNFKGSITRDVDAAIIVAGGITNLGTILGKGEIFSGNIILTAASDIGPLITVSIYCDGVFIAVGSIPAMILSGDTIAESVGQRLILWDRNIFQIVIAVARGVTFGQQYYVRIQNAEAVDITAYIYILWHHVI